MQQKTLNWIIIGITALVSIARADPIKITSQKTEFHATARPGLTIHGTTEDHSEENELQKNKDTLTGKIKVDLNTFKTGISLRDKHLKSKVFDSGRNPFATMEIKELPMKEKAFKGTLSFHGVTKEITGTQEISASAYKVNFSINLGDYGITPPSFMGMKVDDLVKVEINGQLK